MADADQAFADGQEVSLDRRRVTTHEKEWLRRHLFDLRYSRTSVDMLLRGAASVRITSAIATEELVGVARRKKMSTKLAMRYELLTLGYSGNVANVIIAGEAIVNRRRFLRPFEVHRDAEQPIDLPPAEPVDAIVEMPAALATPEATPPPDRAAAADPDPELAPIVFTPPTIPADPPAQARDPAPGFLPSFVPHPLPMRPRPLGRAPLMWDLAQLAEDPFDVVTTSTPSLASVELTIPSLVESPSDGASTPQLAIPTTLEPAVMHFDTVNPSMVFSPMFERQTGSFALRPPTALGSQAEPVQAVVKSEPASEQTTGHIDGQVKVKVEVKVEDDGVGHSDTKTQWR